MQLNEVTFAGFLGKDAVLFKTQNGLDIVTLSVCHTLKSKDGKETSTWLSCKVFGGWADTAKDFRKGDNVMCRGRLQESKWTDKTGQERTSIELICTTVAMFPKSQRAPSETQKPKDENNFNFDDVPF